MMKKVLLFILAFTILSVNAVNAKEGFYAGGSVAVNKAKVKTTDEGGSYNDKSTKPTVSIDLGYKFNFNSFTVAPELYFNLMSQVVKKNGTKLKEFGGLNVKLGYDIDDKLNTFFLVGVSYMDKLKTATDDDEEGVVNTSQKMKQPVMNLGLGAEYEVMDNLDVNLTVVYSFGKAKKAEGDEKDPQYNNIKVSLGANYYFGF